MLNLLDELFLRLQSTSLCVARPHNAQIRSGSIHVHKLAVSFHSVSLYSYDAFARYAFCLGILPQYQISHVVVCWSVRMISLSSTACRQSPPCLPPCTRLHQPNVTCKLNGGQHARPETRSHHVGRNVVIVQTNAKGRHEGQPRGQGDPMSAVVHAFLSERHARYQCLRVRLLDTGGCLCRGRS
jgi:hypothetical protein